MGMYGQVLAIGPFRAALVPCLTHAAWRYDGTRDGAVIVEVVFETPEGSSRSRQLASCFGVDPWDFSTHALDPWRADVEALRAMFSVETVADAPPASGGPVGKFLRLREANFAFYFMPNG
ncbi:hypothetical protein [Labilithrix luteola]|nr:hypothetical protein [Labilithrix luteola]